MTELDQYMLKRLDTLIKEVREDYKNFQFRKAVRAITDYCILDLSSLMLDASKDRLYTLGASSAARRSAQTALFEIVSALLRLLAPVLCFTCEEAWQEIKKLPCGAGLEESIFLADMPQSASYVTSAAVEEKWNNIREIRATVLKSLEEARQQGLIGAPLEAKIIFNSDDAKTKAFLQETLPLWPEVAIVSQAEVSQEQGKAPLEVKVEHAQGTKCPRCWQWRTDIGANGKYPDLCGRCAKVLEEENIDVKVEA